jgi:2-polyprenyl-3-methyl-5-hydroxy-6-metoxy-1,4-benzoquinol methylase
VAAYHVLEHVYHPAERLRAVRRMLVPGGVIHLQVPNHASLTRRLTGRAWASVMFPQHVYSKSSFTQRRRVERRGRRELPRFSAASLFASVPLRETAFP